MLVIGLVKVYPYTEFEVPSFTRSRFTEGDLILKIRPWTLTTPLFKVAYFVISEMGLARIYPYTKFEISSFTRFRFMEGGLKFNFWSLNHNQGFTMCEQLTAAVNSHKSSQK